MSLPNEYHRRLLQKALKEEKERWSQVSGRPLKKRKKKGQESSKADSNNAFNGVSEPIDNSLKIDGGAANSNETDLNDTLPDTKNIPLLNNNETIVDLTNEEDSNIIDESIESEFQDSDFDSDEFEDIDLENSAADFMNKSEDPNEVISVTINKTPLEPKKSKSRPTMVSTKERHLRKKIHILYLFAMVSHGVIINRRLSDNELHSHLISKLPNSLKRELVEYQNQREKKVSSTSKTRKLLDLLRHLMNYWNEIWTIDKRSPILYKKIWNEIQNEETPFAKFPLPKIRYLEAIKQNIGGRDLCTQGYCALLRALGLPARLIFSLQPPDFTNLIQCEIIQSRAQTPNNESISVQNNNKKKKAKNQQERLLGAFKKKPYSNIPKKTLEEEEDEFSQKFGSWPVFWVEVWDKDGKKYITIDPTVKKLIEIVNYKSKLEPPMNCIRNNSWYVIGYDRLGGVRDITRRYAKEYNAKVRKKRIDREEKYAIWWQKLITGSCSEKRKNDNRVDKFEQIDFEDFSQKEGMPSNVGDFLSHPIYVLESGLKWNEILKPMISCGTIRKKTKGGEGELIPVYKRANVQSLRSAKGWYMRGRVLKIGERPLKIHKRPAKKRNGVKNFNSKADNNATDDDDNDARLYAEFQTEKYVPPPVVDGKIPRNAYKNVDVFEPWMIPEDCVHIKDSLAERAAKLLRIEYAVAVTGFDFNKDSSRMAKAKLEGIVTFHEFEAAVEAVCEGLREEDQRDEEMKQELLILRKWKLLLKKLEIRKMLIDEHGDIESDEENHSSKLASEDEVLEGGFIPTMGLDNNKDELYNENGFNEDEYGKFDASEEEAQASESDKEEFSSGTGNIAKSSEMGNSFNRRSLRSTSTKTIGLGDSDLEEFEDFMDDLDVSEDTEAESDYEE